ncbi:hypothetical protein KA977_10835 [Candidatus Dependentiae bacterium]|nr:hypothetical protein [Candidatus Dependentiae bacterium]
MNNKKTVEAKNAFFIKLGAGEMWAEDCIKNNTIRLGFGNPYHKNCLKKDWKKITNFYINKIKKKKTKASEVTNQIRNFYESGNDTIWITFHNRKMYWCFADEEVIELKDKTRIRKTKGLWSDSDIDKNKLTVDKISSKLTQVQGFIGAICSIREFEYLLNKINNKKSEDLLLVENVYNSLQDSLKPLIKNLTWEDFELLTDLIFSYSGWKRVDVLGKYQKAIDLDLMSPVTGKRGFLQVKSYSDLNTFFDYLERFKNMLLYDEMFYVVHSKSKDLENYKGDDSSKIIDIDKLAKLVIDAGLVEWLIEKTY